MISTSPGRMPPRARHRIWSNPQPEAATLSASEKSALLARYTEAYRRGGMNEVLRYRLTILTPRANEYGVPYVLGRIHAVLGDKDKALQWLTRAAEERDDFATHITVDPEFDSLRTDARFQQLLRRIGFPQVKNS